MRHCKRTTMHISSRLSLGGVVTRLTPANLYEGELLNNAIDDFLGADMPDAAEQELPAWEDVPVQVVAENPGVEALEELARIIRK